MPSGSPSKAGLARRRLTAAGLVTLCLAFIAVASAGSAWADAGALYSFGLNYSGELGVALDSGTSNATPTPQPVTLPGATGPVTQVASGPSHSLVVTATGQLYAFGENQAGELGSTVNNGTTNANPAPTPVTLPDGAAPVAEASAGSEFSLVVTTSGQLFAFGNNHYGQLGSATNNGTDNANPVPVLVSLPGATGPVAHVAAGSYHGLVSTTTGQLYAFGANTDGQLGVNTNSGTTTANPTPAAVLLPGAIGPVTAVAAGANASYALTSSGQLYSFGLNQSGQLGIATNSGTSNPNPNPKPVTLPGATGAIAQVAGGAAHTLALTSSGQLYAFGSNGFGQLASPTIGSPNPTPALVSLPAGAGPVTQIDAGGGHSLAVTSSGQLYAFGNNYFGQLGNATNAGTFSPNPPVPVAMPGGDTIDTVGRGTGDDSLVVTADLAIATTSVPAGITATPYAAQLVVSGGAAPYRWTATGLPPGLSIDSATGRISGTPTAAGNGSAIFTVTDSYGIVAARTFSILVTAPAQVPALSGFSVTPRRVARTGRVVHGRCVSTNKVNRKRRACRRALSIRIAYTLSVPATVTITVQRVEVGRRVAGRCVAQTKRNRKRRRCSRVVALHGAITYPSAGGPSSHAWNGRLGGHVLGPGTYRLMATPAAGGLVGSQSTTALIVAR